MHDSYITPKKVAQQLEPEHIQLVKIDSFVKEVKQRPIET